jgi:hypothetical protein
LHQRFSFPERPAPIILDEFSVDTFRCSLYFSHSLDRSLTRSLAHSLFIAFFHCFSIFFFFFFSPFLGPDLGGGRLDGPGPRNGRKISCRHQHVAEERAVALIIPAKVSLLDQLGVALANNKPKKLEKQAGRSVVARIDRSGKTLDGCPFHFQFHFSASSSSSSSSSSWLPRLFLVFISASSYCLALIPLFTSCGS